MAAIAPEQFTHNLNSGIAALRLRAPRQKVAVVGFCFGGGLVWQLLPAAAIVTVSALRARRAAPGENA